MNVSSSHNWLEFKYIHYLWQLCKVNGKSDHSDEHFMLLGGPWKIPTSNREEQVGDAARYL